MWVIHVLPQQQIIYHNRLNGNMRGSQVPASCLTAFEFFCFAHKYAFECISTFCISLLLLFIVGGAVVAVVRDMT